MSVTGPFVPETVHPKTLRPYIILGQFLLKTGNVYTTFDLCKHHFDLYVLIIYCRRHLFWFFAIFNEELYWESTNYRHFLFFSTKNKNIHVDVFYDI